MIGFVRVQVYRLELYIISRFTYTCLYAQFALRGAGAWWSKRFSMWWYFWWWSYIGDFDFCFLFFERRVLHLDLDIQLFVEDLGFLSIRVLIYFEISNSYEMYGLPMLWFLKLLFQSYLGWHGKYSFSFCS